MSYNSKASGQGTAITAGTIGNVTVNKNAGPQKTKIYRKQWKQVTALLDRDLAIQRVKERVDAADKCACIPFSALSPDFAEQFVHRVMCSLMADDRIDRFKKIGTDYIPLNFDLSCTDLTKVLQDASHLEQGAKEGVEKGAALYPDNVPIVCFTYDTTVRAVKKRLDIMTSWIDDAAEQLNEKYPTNKLIFLLGWEPPPNKSPPLNWLTRCKKLYFHFALQAIELKSNVEHTDIRALIETLEKQGHKNSDVMNVLDLLQSESTESTISMNDVCNFNRSGIAGAESYELERE